MFSIAKVISGIVSVTVGAISFTVPVVFKSGGTSRTKRNVSENIGYPGGGVKQTSITKCIESITSNKKVVNFGDQQIGDVCWSIDLGEGLTDSEVLSSLFQEEGKNEKSSGSGKAKEDKGSKECLRDSGLNQGSIMTKSDNGAQYLGLCGDTEAKDTLFVKKVQKPWTQEEGVEIENKGTLQVCNKNCGSNDLSAFGGAVVLETEREDNGKEVKFYKNYRELLDSF